MSFTGGVIAFSDGSSPKAAPNSSLMRITQLESHLLRLPLTRPIAAPPNASERGGRRYEHVFLLVVYLDTDAGHRGLGFAYTLEGGGRALKVIADDDLAPLLLGEDPLDHER